MPPNLVFKTALDDLAKKAPGELILSDDWNDLVNYLRLLGANVQAAQADADAANSDLDKLDAAFQAYKQGAEQNFTTLVNQFYRVTVKSDKQAYAFGQVAILEVQISDPLGRTIEAPYPWVDFVASWGRLKQEGNFESKVGDGDRSISVHVDANGIARARLVVEHAAGFGKDKDDLVSGYISSTKVSSGKTIAQTVLEAATPEAIESVGVYTLITQKYDDKTNPVYMQAFADAYALQNAAVVAGKYTPSTQEWKDSYATVVVFAKGDADPATKEVRHGSASIVVKFRDWMNPWITDGYLGDTHIKALTDEAHGALAGAIDVEDAKTTYTNWRNYVEKKAFENPGLIRQVAEFKAIDHAIENVGVAGQPKFLAGVKKALQTAVQGQQVMAMSLGAAIGVEKSDVVFQVFSDAGGGAMYGGGFEGAEIGGRVAGVEERVTAVEGLVKPVHEQVKAIDALVKEVDSRVGEMEQQTVAWREVSPARIVEMEKSVAIVDQGLKDLKGSDGAIERLRSDVADAKGKADKLVSVSPTEVNNAIAQYTGLRTYVDGAMSRIVNLETQIKQRGGG